MGFIADFESPGPQFSEFSDSDKDLICKWQVTLNYDYIVPLRNSKIWSFHVEAWKKINTNLYLHPRFLICKNVAQNI